MNSKIIVAGVVGAFHAACRENGKSAPQDFDSMTVGVLNSFAHRIIEAHEARRAQSGPNVLDFHELIETQRMLQARMGNPTGTGEAGFKENMLHVIVEAVEAMSEVNFKPWKTKRKEVDRDALATESTDILQFWANAVLGMGLTAEDLTTALRRKWKVNYERIASGEVVDAVERSS